MKNFYGKYKCLDIPNNYFTKINKIEKGDVIYLNEEDVELFYDPFTNECIAFYYKQSIPFKLVDCKIYHKMDKQIGAYYISTNESFGDEIKFYKFTDYFIPIHKHRKKIADMILNL